ncbi:ATP-binding domain-containing protein [Listeria booriae]|uniref:DEAD/DEAH box helicase n=1 Tax=Listeria booriae TaxID=1552123 RepID=UPI00162696DA|nr:ATP-binding domain-containing protein [Listeria booriae]MBC1919137.1 ATP-binding domain-containing protein [Listeria booriae]
MEVMIPLAKFDEDYIAKEIVDNFKEMSDELNLKEATLYHEFPLFKEVGQEIEYPSFLLISPNHGLIVIQTDMRSNRTINDEEFVKLEQHTEQIFTYLFTRLLKVPELRAKRNALLVEINTIIYMPECSNFSATDDDMKVLHNLKDLNSEIQNLEQEALSKERLDAIFSIVEATKAIPKPNERNIEQSETNTKGGILEKLEKNIAVYDTKQKIAVFSQIEGPQRIRGMAGSGKTIILAMKAAILHLRNPDFNILYTFYTKSLYDQVKQLITRFYRMYEDSDPNWEKIHIRHAWGGANLPGVYYEACVDNGVSTVQFKEAQKNAKNSNDVFNYVCKDLLDKVQGNIDRKYDFVLMDEGQDFPASFYWLCRKLTRDDCLVWAYDELQNILDIELQETKTLFENKYGDQGIDLEELQNKYHEKHNDVVLYKSYRTPKEILLLATAIGFGLYNKNILQILENKEHWMDLGYTIESGNCQMGEQTIITRPNEHSPSIISKTQDISEIIKIFSADSMSEEISKLCTWIYEDIFEQKLLPEDIMIISLDDRYARRYFEELEPLLANKNIFSQNVLNSYKGDTFVLKDRVTMTTVYRAKGNEAAMVYVIGADSVGRQEDDILTRNKLFTSFTRSKGWLRITGIGIKEEFVYREYDRIIQDYPYLKFEYPDYDATKTLRRELSTINKKRNTQVEALQKKLDELGLENSEAIELLKENGVEK